MPFEIKYRNKWTGEVETHRYEGNVAGAKGWAESLASEHGSKAECHRTEDNVATGVSREVEHIITVGNNRK
jgi:hypothetical protein